MMTSLKLLIVFLVSSQTELLMQLLQRNPVSESLLKSLRIAL